MIILIFDRINQVLNLNEKTMFEDGEHNDFYEHNDPHHDSDFPDLFPFFLIAMQNRGNNARGGNNVSFKECVIFFLKFMVVSFIIIVSIYFSFSLIE